MSVSGKSERKGLGSLGSRLLSSLSSSQKEIFNVKDAEKVLKIKSSSLRKLLFDLNKNKWIERIERGKYLILPLEAGVNSNYGIDSYSLARRIVEPYYVGFSSALNYYGITEQISKTIFIVTTKKKRSLRFQMQEYRFVTLPKKRFFGVTEEWIGTSKFNISDKEKTIIDCLFLPEYSGGLTEVVKAFRRKLDYEKLYDYALKMNDLATIKRLGYLLDKLNVKTSVTGRLLKKVSGGYCLLDSMQPKTGVKNNKWRVIENISKEELLVES